MSSLQEIELKFPDMKPIKAPPTLYTLNGIGTGVYGNRDFDPATGTYIKTLCICLVFLPVVALSAYRVADADNGAWYFLGKVPLSRFAAGWNKMVAVLLAALIGSVLYAVHTSSLSYVEGKQMASAAAALQAGKTNDAIQIYAELSASGGPRQADARQALQPLAETFLVHGSPENKIFIIRHLAQLQKKVPGSPLVPSLEFEAMKEVQKALEQDPQRGLVIVRFMEPVTTNKLAFSKFRVALLEKVVEKQLATAEQVSELALLYEASGEQEKSVQVLLPYREKLKDSEGARILGQGLLASGEHEGAYQLLYPYVEARLKSMDSALKGYSKALEAASRRILDALNANQYSADFKRISSLQGKAQEKAVDEYIGSRINDHPLVKQAVDRIAQVSKIVPVAFDLGVTQLTRARAMADPEARKKELEAAEKTFLAISSIAGDSEQYKMSLAEVSYWLGREQEGRRLFEEALSKGKRSYEVLVHVVPVLRSVGERKWAYQLSEEAFGKGRNDRERDQAAILCSLASPEIEVTIRWLEKLKEETPMNAVYLFEAKGRKAESSGLDEEAAKQYLLALEKYKQLPENVTLLNNQALCCLSLYQVTGKMSYRQLCTSLQKKAVDLAPQDSIVLFNSSVSLLGQAFLEVAGETMNMETVRGDGSLRLAAFLYNDAGQKAVLCQKLKNKECYRKFWEFLDRTLLLSPKNSQAYSIALSVQEWSRDLEGLKRLHEQLARVDLDVSDHRANAMEHFSGKKDEQEADERKRMAIKYQRLLKGVSEKESPASFAYLAAFAVGIDLATQRQDKTVDLDGCVCLAERAYTASTSSATRSVLGAALAARAIQTFAKEDPAIQELEQKTWRSLSSTLQLAWLLSKDAETAQKIARNTDVQRYLSLQREMAQHFPDAFSPSDWALFRYTEPALADRIRQGLLKTEECALLCQLARHLTPCSANTILSSHWQALLAGDPVTGRRYLEEGAKAGVPLP